MNYMKNLPYQKNSQFFQMLVKIFCRIKQDPDRLFVIVTWELSFTMTAHIAFSYIIFLANICLVNKRNTKKRCEVSSK